jgi:uncharacterized protein with von Willebrand factor type A (vWA) domain
VRVEAIHLDLPSFVGAFTRRLHDAGVPMTPARSADLAHALQLVKPVSRRRLYWTARAVVVTDPTHVKAFDAVFAAVFGPHEIVAPERTATPPGHEGVLPGEGKGERVVDVPVPLPSDDEVLAEKRFDALEPDELARLYRLMARLRLETPQRLTRRYERGRGRRLDMRRTLRGSLRTAGEPMRLAHRHRRIQRRRLVLLCDISGSMEPYARAYLQFLTSAAGSDRRAEAFVFATRLTRLTRALASRNPERAIQRAAETAPDWSSGTRIGDALKAFNDRHGRRGLARGAVVVIISDGWERGDPALVGLQMARLARLAHRIVWVNPRVSATGFSVQTGGMVAALPHCDALVSGHSFNAMGEVVAAIGGAELELPEAGPEPEETWASATPVAGSSVAMPSGYGPSRGRTTPGWT